MGTYSIELGGFDSIYDGTLAYRDRGLCGSLLGSSFGLLDDERPGLFLRQPYLRWHCAKPILTTWHRMLLPPDRGSDGQTPGCSSCYHTGRTQTTADFPLTTGHAYPGPETVSFPDADIQQRETQHANQVDKFQPITVITVAEPLFNFQIQTGCHHAETGGCSAGGYPYMQDERAGTHELEPGDLCWLRLLWTHRSRFSVKQFAADSLLFTTNMQNGLPGS